MTAFLTGPEFLAVFGSGALVGAAITLGVVAWLLHERHLRQCAARWAGFRVLRYVSSSETGGDAA